MTRPIPNPQTSFTPPNVDWLVFQAMNVLPALNGELYQLNKMRLKLNTLLDEKALNAEQRRELSALLDMLFKRGIIFEGYERSNSERSEAEDMENDNSSQA